MGTSLAVPAPFAHRVNAPQGRTSRVLAKPRESLRPQSQGFFSGCRQTCVEVPHYLQHCGVGGAYLGRPSWPAATRIALGDQFFRLASLRFSFLFLWLNEKKNSECAPASCHLSFNSLCAALCLGLPFRQKIGNTGHHGTPKCAGQESKKQR